MRALLAITASMFIAASVFGTFDPSGARLSLCRFCLGCIIVTRGYDFSEGQAVEGDLGSGRQGARLVAQFEDPLP
jgi:hypothetical protein